MATPEKTKALAVAQAWKGRALREVAAEFGVSHVTVARWVKEAGPAPFEAPAPAPAPTDAPGSEASVLDTLSLIREQLASAVQIARDAKAVGHYDAAASALRQIAVILPILARVEAKVGDDRDTIKIPRAEFEAAQRSLAERIDGYASKPAYCAECGREMRATTAGLAEDARARLFDHSKKPA